MASRVPAPADPVDLSDESGVRQHHFGRDHPTSQQQAIAVQVVEDQPEQAGALHDAGLESGPLIGGDGDRQRVQVPGPVPDPRVLIRRRDAVLDAVVVDEVPGLLPRREQAAMAHRLDRGGELHLLRSAMIAMAEEFVEPASLRLACAVLGQVAGRVRPARLNATHSRTLASEAVAVPAKVESRRVFAAGGGISTPGGRARGDQVDRTRGVPTRLEPGRAAGLGLIALTGRSSYSRPPGWTT